MMFRDQVGVLASWFKGWNECEQTVALLSLLKRVSRTQARFLQLCLEHSLADCTELHVLEVEANNPGKKNSLLLQKFQKDLNAGVFNTQENELLKQIIRQDREMMMTVERKQSVTGANSTPMSGNSIINSPAQPPFLNNQFQQHPQFSPMTSLPPMTYSTSASIIPAARLAGSVAFVSPGNPATPLQQQPTPGGIMSPCSFTAGRTFQYGSPTASQLSLVPQLTGVPTQQQQSTQPQQASPQRNEVHSSLSRDVRHLSASQPSLPHETSLAIRQHQSSGESLASIQPAVSPSPQTPGSAPQQAAIRGTVPPRVALFRQMSSGALPPVRPPPSTVQHRDPMGSRRESAVLSSSAETEQDKLRFASNL
ncbi:Potassium/sodium hyperpolarization-activated cyclic nucleotide-gated channel 1 [Bagarius yarrelli]|uniref:Potassium/sodium hyperpolarization-activated cyclic nucleotide-gated channel 1 n=1 Tax=Bagarius yarrelli TaxID=175774 RepID=A0A556TUR3_BAGYA|nr:Potassium/sodium hyperpolarization-activated cyclic nucleotide-gated channel 1 [Bagarius yarrelli]